MISVPHYLCIYKNIENGNGEYVKKTTNPPKMFCFMFVWCFFHFDKLHYIIECSSFTGHPTPTTLSLLKLKVLIEPPEPPLDPPLSKANYTRVFWLGSFISLFYFWHFFSLFFIWFWPLKSIYNYIYPITYIIWKTQDSRLYVSLTSVSTGTGRVGENHP